MKSTHALRAPAQALYDRCAFAWSQAVASEDLLNLARFDIWHRLDLGFLPAPLARVMLGLAPAGEVAAKAHGDRACGDLGQARGDHEVADGDRARDTSGESKRHSEPVGHPNHHVANRVACRECLSECSGCRCIG